MFLSMGRVIKCYLDESPIFLMIGLMIFLQKVVDNSRLCAVKVVVGCFIALFDGKKNSNEC